MRVTLALLLLILQSASTHAEDWPQFRGPTGQGITSAKDLPTTWSPKGENILWKTELPKSSAPFSSPVIAGDRIYLTYADDKEPRSHGVMALDRGDGHILWKTDVPLGPWKGGRNNGYPTPCAADGRVYCVLGSAVVVCLDAEGKIAWRYDLKSYAFDVAMGSSPILYKDLLILLCDQTSKTSSLLAFDRKSGEVRYDAVRNNTGFAHSTPVLATINGVEQLVVMVNKALQGIDPATGNVLWQCKASGDTSSPAISGTRIYADSGRGNQGICVDLAAWKPAGGAEPAKIDPVWQTEKLKESLGSPIIVGGNVYRQIGDTLYCWDLATGKQIYAENKLTGGSSRISPFLTADGLLYFCSGGRSFAIRTGTTFEIVGKSDLQDGNDASPAVADGKIYIRGAKYLWCVGKK
jgi:outer membrane protein assembly factor BamB